MPSPPRQRVPDSTLGLLRDPYRWISRRAEAHGRPLFAARLLGERTIFVTGPDAAAMFFAPGRMTRRGALPKPILWLLQDEGSVTVQDDVPHEVRKAMFLSLMTPDRLARFDEILREEWASATASWTRGSSVVLDTAAREVLCRTVCRWAGIPLGPSEAPRRAADMMAMFDGAGAVGRRRLRAWVARRRTERWMGGIAADARSGRRPAEPGSAMAAMLAHREPGGEPLSDELLMTELVNLVRPTVAIARYITFAALALHANPSERRFLESGARAPSVRPEVGDPGAAVDDRTDPVWRFVQEVRRTAPFFPLLGGRVLRPFEWEGHRFEQGVRVIFDLHGTNHDPGAWPDPGAFLPERFLGWEGDPFRLVPQGAGDPATDHRCPGEWLTIAALKTVVRSLVFELDYVVESQDLSLRMQRIPTRPSTGFVLRVRGLRDLPGAAGEARAVAGATAGARR